MPIRAFLRRRCVGLACTAVGGLLMVSAPAGASQTLGQDFTPTTPCPSETYYPYTGGEANGYAIAGPRRPDVVAIHDRVQRGHGLPLQGGTRRLRHHGGHTRRGRGRPGGRLLRLPSGPHLGRGRRPHRVLPSPRYAPVPGEGDGWYRGSVAGAGRSGAEHIDALQRPGPRHTSSPISAQLEPDRDGDGFGDETQDLCPTNSQTQGACPSLGALTTTGGGVGPAGTALVDTTRPNLGSFGFSSSTFRAAKSGAAFDARTKRKRSNAPIGTKVSFRLSEAGAVRSTVDRKAGGRNVDGRCKAKGR